MITYYIVHCMNLSYIGWPGHTHLRAISSKPFDHEDLRLRRGPHQPAMCRIRCWHRWEYCNGPCTQLPHTGAGCPLSESVGRWFLPVPAPEPLTDLLLTAPRTQRSASHLG